jgi:hypothetical protein
MEKFCKNDVDNVETIRMYLMSASDFQLDARILLDDNKPKGKKQLCEKKQGGQLSSEKLFSILSDFLDKAKNKGYRRILDLGYGKVPEITVDKRDTSIARIDDNYLYFDIMLTDDGKSGEKLNEILKQYEKRVGIKIEPEGNFLRNLGTVKYNVKVPKKDVIKILNKGPDLFKDIELLQTQERKAKERVVEQIRGVPQRNQELRRKVYDGLVANKEQRQRQREEAARRQREEAERRQREEAERRQREEAERRQREETERRQRQEEAERREREETERRQREEAARRQREEAERRQREEAARRQREEAERRQREEAARRQREEAERRQREEAVGIQRPRKTQKLVKGLINPGTNDYYIDPVIVYSNDAQSPNYGQPVTKERSKELELSNMNVRDAIQYFQRMRVTTQNNVLSDFVRVQIRKMRLTKNNEWKRMTLQEKETEITELRQRDEELKRQHATHVETLNGYNSELQSILERLGDIEQEITSATQIKGAKVALLDQLRREISALTGKIKDPDSKREQKIAEKREILNGLQEGLIQISRDLESKRSEFKEVSEELVRVEQETQEIIQDTGNILGQIDQIKRDIQTYESEEFILQGKKSLTLELRSIRASIESKNTELQGLLRETQHVENELEGKLSTIRKTEITNNGLEKLLKTIDEDIEKKENSLKRMEASKKRMKEENRANKEKQTKTAVKLDELDKEIRLVRENIGKKTEQNSKLQTQIDENELRYASLVKTYDSKQSILDRLMKHLNVTRDQHDVEMKELNRERQTLMERISALEEEKVLLSQLLKTNEKALQTDIDKMKSIIKEKDTELDLLNKRKLSKKRKIEETRERITEKQIILDESMYDSVKRMVRDIDFKKHSPTAVLLFVFITFVILTYVYGQKIYDFFDSRANIKNREELRLLKQTNYLGVYEYLEKDKLVSQLLKDNPVYLNALVFFTPVGKERSRQDILKAYTLYGKN